MNLVFIGRDHRLGPIPPRKVYVAREELQLEAKRFTNSAALAREVLHLLDESDCKVIVLVTEKGLERIAAELDGRVTMGRVKVVKLEEEVKEEQQ